MSLADRKVDIDMMEVRISPPSAVEQIIGILAEHGYDAYVVGGCVRDAILGKEPNDWDITTSAKPEEVKTLFRKTIDTGIAHGTVTVMIGREGYEVTTYRIDGEYQDGRHPVSVEFTGNLVEDLKRRDFTINAMAYNSVAGVVDAFQGMEDLKKGMIRCVGNPLERFEEDALRMLRGIRFSAGLGFEIEEGTWNAIKTLAPNIEKISKERIRVELDKLLISLQPQKIAYVYEVGLSQYIFTELDQLVKEDRLDFVLDLLQKVEQEHFLRWCALLYFTEVEECKDILKDLRFDNHMIDIVSNLKLALEDSLPKGVVETRKSLSRVGGEIYPYYISMEKALARYSMEELQAWEKNYQEILKNQDCISLKQLAVNGKDIIALGVPRGTKVGEMLDYLLNKVLECPECNKREKLLEMIRERGL